MLEARLKPEGSNFAVHCAWRDCGLRLGTFDPETGRFWPGTGRNAGMHYLKLKAKPRTIVGVKPPYEMTCPRCHHSQKIEGPKMLRTVP